MAKLISAETLCPCGLGQPFDLCCGPYLQGAPAPSAEALMRSRYTAYVLADLAYLKATWHPQTLPTDFNLDAQRDARWLGLQVRHHEVLDEEHARVEFVARYKINGRAFRLHELSRFEKYAGRWVYRDGDVA